MRPGPPTVNVPGGKMLESGDGWSLQRVDDVMILSFRQGCFNVALSPADPPPLLPDELAAPPELERDQTGEAAGPLP